MPIKVSAGQPFDCKNSVINLQGHSYAVLKPSRQCNVLNMHIWADSEEVLRDQVLRLDRG